MYYALHIYVLLSSHQISLVYIYIYAESSVLHTCFVFGQNYSHGRVDLWPESTHVHTLSHPHPHTHLPTSRLAWSSRTMSHLEGNLSVASSSVAASSAVNSSSVDLPPRQPRIRIRWMRVSRRRRFCNLQTRRKPRSARTTRAFRSRFSHLWPAGGS